MFGARSYDPYRPAISAMPVVVVYGTDWCAKTMMIRRYLERRGIPYRYVDLETSPQAVAQLRWWTGGYVSHPTVSIGGNVLVEPSVAELDQVLARIAIR